MAVLDQLFHRLLSAWPPHGCRGLTLTSVNALMTGVDLVNASFQRLKGTTVRLLHRRTSLRRVVSPLTGQYEKIILESWSLWGHPDLQRTMSSIQVGSLCCAVWYLCKVSALDRSRETTSATNHSVWLSYAACVQSGVATGALESATAVCRCLPAT